MGKEASFATVIKRTGERVPYNPDRIALAIQKAFRSSQQDISSESLQKLIEKIAEYLHAQDVRGSVHIEQIQDAVEMALMRSDYLLVAKQYIIYRQKRTEERLANAINTINRQDHIQPLQIKKRDGRPDTFEAEKIKAVLRRVSKDLEVPIEPIITELQKNIYSGISCIEIEDALVLSTVSFIEQDTEYDTIAMRLLRQKLYKEVCKKSAVSQEDLHKKYREAFVAGITEGTAKGVFTQALSAFDLEELGETLNIERDDLLTFLGVRTLYDRYFVKQDGRCTETPQAFWMRVAMGLCINETEKNTKAKEFYETLSNLRYIPSTPTLFHSGLSHPQLSSCYISTISDDLSSIFKCIGDNAQMAKWSGGIGNDWTSVRSTNALIKSTNVESQGVIPFLKIANDTTLAINRSGKRRGATCAYLETWHLDIEDFLDLRRNTGDDRRRTHDMNTANWIPDLFMKRVEQKSTWTLFSPNEVPDLHELCGSTFEKRYEEYERMAEEGSIRLFKKVEAVKLWRKMLTRLFETGHAWITFKDPCNIRSPQDHVGVVHSSNLCTEITLNNSSEETAVCNLGSVNLKHHVTKDGLNHLLLAQTVKTAMRMLDNVIDINFYPTKEAAASNLKHRPVGLGIMGLQDMLFTLRLPFEDPKTIDFMDSAMEFISYHAILTSSELAKERGAYASFKGSKWDRGIFPLDTIPMLEKERGQKIEVDRKSCMEWDTVREHVKTYGMRNSNTMAVAPTATISNIAGCFPCIEPIYRNIYVKSNMSGEFTIINTYLVNDLKKLGLWIPKMIDRLKYYDGNIEYIEEIPADLKALYKETFEVDPIVLNKLTAVRSKWIDQSQSYSLFIKGVSGIKLHEVYMDAWKRGLKTTYYLRTLGASQIEKSTLDAKVYGYTQKREYKACSIDDPDCESCQ